MESKCPRQEVPGATLQFAPSKRKPQHLRQCQLSPRGTGCSVWLCKDSAAGSYLFPTAASCGRRQVFGKGLNKTSCSRSRASPGTQTPTWHPGYQCHPLNSSCLPAFSAWNPCWVVLCDLKQLPNSHPGCVGSEGWRPYVYPHTLATRTQRPALPGHVNSKPIIYQLVCKVLWNRKGPVKT